MRRQHQTPRQTWVVRGRAFPRFPRPAGVALCAAWPFTHAAPPHGERTAVMTPGNPDEAEKLWPTPLIEGRVMT